MRTSDNTSPYDALKHPLENATPEVLSGFGLMPSLTIFGAACGLMFLATRVVIPTLNQEADIESVVCWFIAASFGVFVPLMVAALVILRREPRWRGLDTWRGRLRFRKMTRRDWTWAVGSIVVIVTLTAALMAGLQRIVPDFSGHPSFMTMKPVNPGRFWILVAWFPYWILNIMGEEILWRGVVLPRQEVTFGNWTWLVHGSGWALFHIPFGWELLIILVPILYVQSFAVQHTRNSWVGVVIHAGINGPSFLAIALGVI